MRNEVVAVTSFALGVLITLFAVHDPSGPHVALLTGPPHPQVPAFVDAERGVAAPLAISPVVAAGNADQDLIVTVKCASPSGASDDAPRAGYVTQRGTQRMELGIMRPDAPYGRGGTCRATTERWPFTGPGGVALSTLKSAKHGASCGASLEALNAHAPLRGVDTCARNNRRWADKKEFEAHMDYDATERRKKGVAFLASVCPPRPKQRLVFFDAGCRAYDSSTAWFRTHYPRGADFDVYGLDVAGRYAPGFIKDKKAGFYHGAVWNESGFVTFLMKRDLEADGYFHTRWLDQPVPPLRTKLVTVPTVPFGDFIMQRSKPEDFVVVKLDIEGAEWMVLEHLARSGALAYIDEMFIECHHGEWVPQWPTQHSLADCHRMFNALRDYGIFAHEWY
jgi:FkbM family methyltransferase